MSGKTEKLVLEHLRAICSDIGFIRDDMKEVKSRIVSVESGVANLKREAADAYGDMADQHARHDRLADRVERIEKQLDIKDAP